MMGAGVLGFDQINLHHCKEASAELSRRLSSDDTDIALIQEPYIYKGVVRGLGNSGILHYMSSSDAQARACIYTRKGINAVMLRQFSSRDFVAVRLRLGSNEDPLDIICCSAYLPYDEMVPTKQLREVLDHCEKHNIHYLVGCDANAHHIVWGSSDTNIRGARLMEFICESNAVLLNKGNRPTFVNRLREEVIDITLCSMSIEGLIKGWHVSREDSLSDHQTICFGLTCELSKTESYRNPRKTNFLSFQERLRRRLDSWDLTVKSPAELDQAVETLTECIVMSYQEACPLRKPPVKKKTPWFSSKLEQLRKACNYAWNHRARDGMEAVRIARNAYRVECRKSQKDSWRKFCESVEGIQASARIHKLLSKDRNHQVDTLRLSNGDYISEEKEVLKHLLSTHFPECVEVSDITPGVSDVGGGTRNTWLKCRRITNRGDIRKAIKSFHPYKSAGMDGIFPVLLQRGLDIIINPLHEIFTASLALGYIPRLWREVKVVFIPKPGRASYEEAKSHRPISLSSFLLKSLERLVDWHIRRTTLSKKPLCFNQHAYQRGKSTMTAIHRFTDHIEI